MFFLDLNTRLKATYNIPAIEANLMWEYKRKLGYGVNKNHW